MDRRKELKQKYKEMKMPMGIFQIKNIESGKIFIGSSSDLNSIKNRHWFQLQCGSHVNRNLQNDWKMCGEGNFTFDVIEYLEPLDDNNCDYSDDLKVLEDMWREKLIGTVELY